MVSVVGVHVIQYTVVILLCQVHALSSPVEPVERVPGAVAHFDFTREECLRNSFMDHSSSSSVGSITRTGTSSQCLNGNGLSWQPNSPTPAKDDITSGPLTELLRILNGTKEMTFDFWVEADSAEAAYETLPVLSFLYRSPSAPCAASLRVRPYDPIHLPSLHCMPSLCV